MVNPQRQQPPVLEGGRPATPDWDGHRNGHRNGNGGWKRPPTPRRAAWLGRPITAEGNTVGQLARLLLFGLLLLLALGGAVAPWAAINHADLPVGAVADRTFTAPRSLIYISDVRTQDRRDEVENAPENRVFTRDPNVAARQGAELQSALNQLTDIRNLQQLPEDARIKAVQGQIDGLSNEEARQVLLLDGPRWAAVSGAARRLLDDAMSREVRPDNLQDVREGLRSRVDPSLDPSERALALAVARNFVKPNMAENLELTKQKREEASRAVQPVTVAVQEGQTIVREGETVTRAHREQLEKFGLLRPRVDWPALLGILGLVAILIFLLVAYLYRFHRPVWRGRQLVLLGLTVALPIVAARLALGSHPTWVYAFPIAAAAMLTTVLLNLPLATTVALVGSLALGLLGLGSGADSLEYATLAFIPSIVGAFLLWRADRIAHFLWAGVGVGLAVFAVGACFRLAAGTLDPMGLAQIAIMAAFNGGLASVLTFGSFSFLGGLFGITTHLQLLELAHPNQPLLYKLAREAPGTYHHSIVVSNLAESAVELVGGDPLFTRVAVLYHDIGKTLRPTFFIENQANRDNVHDVLDPQQSARIIIDHVTDGVRLARKARLPEPIIDIIRQHHGTMLIRYFYNRALESGDEVREEDFRYPGPRPQTKEAGVIMLADSVEAAVRAAAHSGKLNFGDEPRRPREGGANGASPPQAERREGRGSKLQELVEQVIDDRVKSGQLDDCDLTLRDIDRIKRTFVQVLDGIYHPRIDYPPAPAPSREPAPAEPAVTG